MADKDRGSSEGRLSLGENKKTLRLKFWIWPNRQQPIEASFYQELLAEITRDDPDYKPWMVTIGFEPEARVERPVQPWLWARRN